MRWPNFISTACRCARIARWAIFFYGVSLSAQNSLNDPQASFESELQTGTTLTRQGSFRDAIPHLLAARGHVTNEYAASFNLALCYVATDQFKNAITLLNALRSDGVHDNGDVNNLLAQAYVGDGQSQEAFTALQAASSHMANNEKLYVFVADACNDRKNYELGLKTVDLGLRYLPDSPRLHYQRAMFLASLDRLDMAQSDFALAAKLAPDSEIAFLASAQKSLFDGDVSAAAQAAREGIKKGFGGDALLSVLGEALIREGVSPGEPAFAEAKAALEKSVAMRPNYAGSLIALGKLSLMENHLDQAIRYLEHARQLAPGNRSIYSHLATAYRRYGDTKMAQGMLLVLSQLNREEAEKIGSAPGDRKASYGASGNELEAPPRP